MKILVLGSGGREHALAKKFLASPLVSTVYCAPGNPGMLQDHIQTIALATDEQAALIDFVKKEQITWTFVGPEQPLLEGIVDAFQAENLLIFGPTQAAALIEGSKDFAKQFMQKYEIPTAHYRTFSAYEAAVDYLETQPFPIVIKADGLAAGKGVIIAETLAQAQQAVTEMLQENKYGQSGAKVVIEEFLVGEEFSLMAFVRNEEVYPMPVSQDHKRIFDQDQGPNTGGMGAYCPAPQISPEIVTQTLAEVLQPTASGLLKEGRAFTGILYAGLILTEDGPKVIEFNARFGDPETQVVLPCLTSDLVADVDDLLHGRTPTLQWDTTYKHVGVVLAASGYPEQAQSGQAVPDFTDDVAVQCYFSGVASNNQQLVAAGGRVLLVESAADSLQTAQQKVYQALAAMDTTGYHYRRDIAARGIAFEQKNN